MIKKTYSMLDYTIRFDSANNDYTIVLGMRPMHFNRRTNSIASYPVLSLKRHCCIAFLILRRSF